MQLDVTGHHVELTDSLRKYVTSKLEKIERHFDQVTDVHCILTVEKLRQKAEGTISVNGAKIYADAPDEDMYAAIDALADQLHRQAKTHKAKHEDNHATDADQRKLR